MAALLIANPSSRLDRRTTEPAGSGARGADDGRVIRTMVTPLHSPAVPGGAKFPVFLAVALLLAGCGSAGDKQGTPVDVGSTINYGSVGTKAEIDCQGKSLNVGGSNNTLTVTGTCASISVGGADNTITVNRIDGELSVVGLNNRVAYKNGDPTVNDTGSGNRISRG
jgi:hypothetical protein